MKSRFFELKNITKGSVEPMEFKIRSGDRSLIPDPRNREITLVKASLALDVPLTITVENQFDYFILLGEADLFKPYNFKDSFIFKPHTKRNRFTSYLNNGFYDNVPDVISNPCRFAILP